MFILRKSNKEIWWCKYRRLKNLLRKLSETFGSLVDQMVDCLSATFQDTHQVFWYLQAVITAYLNPLKK